MLLVVITTRSSISLASAMSKTLADTMRMFWWLVFISVSFHPSIADPAAHQCSIRVLRGRQGKPVLREPAAGLLEFACLCFPNVIPDSSLHVGAGCLQERGENSASLWTVNSPNLDNVRLFKAGKNGQQT